MTVVRSAASSGTREQTGDAQMAAQESQNQRNTIAVAVRDGSDLFLFASISRGLKGDVYVNFPRDREPKWKPHSSYHASGQHHHKSFGYNALVHHRKKPDVNFSGTENLVTTGISREEPREINVPCPTADFDDVFEIPISDLRPEKYRTYLSVDLAEPNGSPIIYPGAKVIRQKITQNVIPRILITLFNTYPDKV